MKNSKAISPLPLSFYREGLSIRESKRGFAVNILYRESRRGEAPPKQLLPLPLIEGEGDTGDGVTLSNIQHKSDNSLTSQHYPTKIVAAIKKQGE